MRLYTEGCYEMQHVYDCTMYRHVCKREKWSSRKGGGQSSSRYNYSYDISYITHLNFLLKVFSRLFIQTKLFLSCTGCFKQILKQNYNTKFNRHFWYKKRLDMKVSNYNQNSHLPCLECHALVRDHQMVKYQNFCHSFYS